MGDETKTFLTQNDFNLLAHPFSVIKDVDGDGVISVAEQSGAHKELAGRLASIAYQSNPWVIDGYEVNAFAVTSRALLQALKDKAGQESDLSAPRFARFFQQVQDAAALLAQLNQALQLFRDRQAVRENDWIPLNEYFSLDYDNIYELSQSDDPADKWLATTILGVTTYLWPDVKNDHCDTGIHEQAVCDASTRLALNIKDSSGVAIDRPVDIGPNTVIPQLKQAIIDKLLATVEE